jgi:hypothetical protein
MVCAGYRRLPHAPEGYDEDGVEKLTSPYFIGFPWAARNACTG